MKVYFFWNYWQLLMNHFLKEIKASYREQTLLNYCCVNRFFQKVECGIAYLTSYYNLTMAERTEISSLRKFGLIRTPDQEY